MKKLFTLLLLLGLTPISMMAQWHPLNSGKTNKIAPVVKIISDDVNSTVIKIDISGFDVSEFYSGNKLYQSINLLSDASSSLVGAPDLPYVSSVLAIPDKAGVSVEVIETGSLQTFENINLPPCRASWFEGKPETPYVENESIYSSSDVFPNSMASVGTPAIFRDFRIVRLSVYPIRYVPSKKELQVTSSITVRIRYNTEKSVNLKTKQTKSIAPSFAKIYESFILNYKSALSNLYYGDENGRDVLLAIMPDSYVSTFQPYADWKRQSGIDVHITKFSDIGANASDATIIKNHITDAYHNWEFPPTYVLLIGDDGICPKKTVSYDYSFASEDYFVEIDGNDYFPEMMIGRLPVQSTNTLNVCTTKAMNYEKTPYTANTAWFKKGVCCSNNEYLSQIETKRFAANVMINDGGFTSVDTLMSNQPCTMSVSDVIQVINDGRSFLNYRGEGWNTGWWATCTPMTVSDLSNLNNGTKLTFVTSIGCGVAMFDASGGNCFGEEWIKLGTATSPRGAVAFVGPTSNTHTQYNNKIDKGIYVGMFREGLETPGQALLRGKLYMYNCYGNDTWMEYQYRIFTVLGDPSVHIWKEVPLAVHVNHPVSVPMGYSQPQISVTYNGTGLPVNHAHVTITGTNVFASGFTDSTGNVIIGITPVTLDSLTVTVCGGDVIPYQGKMAVTQSAIHVGPLGLPHIVGSGGSLDSIMNPNENLTIAFTLKNWGLQTANNTTATITSLNSNMQVITTTAISYGNIASGNSVVGSPYQIHINQNSEIGSLVKIKLHVTSGTNSWDYLYYQEVKGCELEYISTTVDDAASIYPNTSLDPGETSKLYISIKNTGVDNAPNVQGILKSSDPYITIIDSVGTYGLIKIDSTETDNSDYYVVTISSMCPIDYEAEFSLKLSTQGGNYPYNKTVTFSLPVAEADSLDPTGPDTYGYYAYSSVDTLYEQSPVYNWVEINQVGTEIPITNSEQTTTVNIPFSFKYYGSSFNQVRISTDGWIAFGSGTQTAYSNAALPDADGIQSMTAVFWDDLVDNGTSFQINQIFYFNDITNHRFIIEWDSLAHWNDGASPKYEVFQIILNNPAFYTNPPTGDGEIICQYKKVSVSNSCTVGIENNTEDGALQYLNNNSYANTASHLKNSFAIKFTTELPTLKYHISVPEVPGDVNVYGLKNVFPNPFDQSITIHYSIPDQSNISLRIYDISGRLIKVLKDGKQSGGNYTVKWNGQDDKGNQVSEGMYFVKLNSDGFNQTMKLCKLKVSQK
ncbi:MAG: C25 family cysteine peptidase [Bacteroidota bacterium]